MYILPINYYPQNRVNHNINFQGTGKQVAKYIAPAVSAIAAAAVAGTKTDKNMAAKRTAEPDLSTYDKLRRFTMDVN